MRNVKMKQARIAMNYSQQDLAKKIGVTRQTIGLIESGDYNPSLNLCLDICWALNLTLDDLFWKGKNDESR